VHRLLSGNPATVISLKEIYSGKLVSTKAILISVDKCLHLNACIVFLTVFATRLSSILGDSFAAHYGFHLASFRYTKNLHPNSCSPAMPTQDQTVQFLRRQTLLIPYFRHFLCHASSLSSFFFKTLVFHVSNLRSQQ
jgi:hypothetical protein